MISLSIFSYSIYYLAFVVLRRYTSVSLLKNSSLSVASARQSAVKAKFFANFKFSYSTFSSSLAYDLNFIMSLNLLEPIPGLAVAVGWLTSSLSATGKLSTILKSEKIEI